MVDTSASGKGYGLEDFLVTLLFGTVVLLLAVVTGGVAYINLKQWLDNRQEKQDREGAVLPAASEPANTSAAAPSDEVVVPLKRASRIKKEKGKGFAEFTSRR